MSTGTLTEHRFGTVALVGRPNVGKSTLLNALVGAKLTIVTPKPQTTRNRIVGICNRPDAQVAFLDTPGIHAPRSPLGRRMVDLARQACAEADTVVVIVDASGGVRRDDERILSECAAAGPLLVAVNKIDRVGKPRLLPLLGALGHLVPGRPLVPISAREGTQVDVLLREIVATLPVGPPHFPPDAYTTASERFLVQEIVREQVFLATREEVPYGTAVVVERFAEDEPRGLTEIDATILVERDSHRGMVIGAQGAMLSKIGRQARLAIEELLGKRVHLGLFVRVEPDWARRRDRLAELEL